MRADNSSEPKAGAAHAVNAGPVVTLFSHAFRPFFLAAGAYSFIAMLAWLAWILASVADQTPVLPAPSMAPHYWHAHEMIFGFAAAAVAGFMLTAVPSWTGAERSKGRALAAIFAIWLLGRMGMWMTAILPPVLVAISDLGFLPLLGLAAGRQLAVKPSRANVFFVGLIAVLFAANLMFHLTALGIVESGMHHGVLLGLGTLVVMITIIGGRVIPGFTTNALRRRGIEDGLPERRDKLDIGSIVLALAFFLLLLLGAPNAATAFVALLAAVINGARLWFWRPLKTLGEPIVWVLHLGYFWIVAGYALAGVAIILGQQEETALHAFAGGAVGTMTLAIMSRASLGHTGRPLNAPAAIVAAYIFVSVATVLRVCGPIVAPGLYNEVMFAAGLFWVAAFMFFTAVFAPILLRPRQQ